DTVFLIDTSGSVPQEWVTQIIAGVRQSLGSLNEGDRFNLVLFNERPAFLSVDGPLPATQANIDQAHRFLAGARSQGWTDVNAALSRLLVRDVAAQRVYNLILISDGKPTRGVLSTRDLINLITRDNNLAASIYCVGVGPQQNRELLEFLAYRNQGLCVFVDRVDHVAAALRDLASRLRYPLIKNLHVSVAGQEVGQVYPVHLPNVHQGQRLSIYGRYTTLAEFTVHITGDSADGPVDFTFTRDLNAALPEGRELARAWALWKLHHLYSQILHHEGPDPSIQRQIDDLRRRYGLKTLY
ncbi:MAG TPA: VWA domain-containing protein, partial [Phycisphaeraceae bacterium]